MAIMQGSSYELPIKIMDCGGSKEITGDIVDDVSFTFGDFTKGLADGVRFDGEKGAWIVPLEECETFLFKDAVQWQARFLFSDGKVDGTVPKSEYVYDSINRVKLSRGGGENA